MGTVFKTIRKKKEHLLTQRTLQKQNPHFPELCVSTFSNGIIDKLLL